MIPAVPGVNAVTTPELLTVATVAAPLDQLIAPVAIGALFWSSPETLAAVVPPGCNVPLPSETLIVVSTGAGALGVLGVLGEPPPALPPPPPPQLLTQTNDKSANHTVATRVLGCIRNAPT